MVYFAMGGTGKIVLELTKLLESIGVSVKLNTTIEKIKIDNSRISELIDSRGIVHILIFTFLIWTHYTYTKIS